MGGYQWACRVLVGVGVFMGLGGICREWSGSALRGRGGGRA